MLAKLVHIFPLSSLHVQLEHCELSLCIFKMPPSDGTGNVNAVGMCAFGTYAQMNYFDAAHVTYICAQIRMIPTGDLCTV